jgi:cytochrome c-type biogenesis protein CcmH
VDEGDPAARLGTPGERIMKRCTSLRALWGACALLASLTAGALDTTQFADPALQARYVELTHELRCMQCQNESLADSPVDLAADLRRQVRELLIAGKSDDEIRDWMAARYSDFILFRPRHTWRNAWLWGLPLILLVLGGLASWRILRQRAQLLPGDLQDPDEEER